MVIYNETHLPPYYSLAHFCKVLLDLLAINTKHYSEGLCTTFKFGDFTVHTLLLLSSEYVCGGTCPFFPLTSENMNMFLSQLHFWAHMLVWASI